MRLARLLRLALFRHRDDTEADMIAAPFGLEPQALGGDSRRPLRFTISQNGGGVLDMNSLRHIRWQRAECEQLKKDLSGVPKTL